LSAASPSARSRVARSASFCPASVSASRREVRLNSRAPSRSSSRPTALETVAFDSASSPAAPAKDRNSTTFAKIASASKSGSFAMDVHLRSILETMNFDSFYFYITAGGIPKVHRISSQEIQTRRNPMTRKLSGKVALVTGGSRGIGAASARALANEGADVAISYVASPDKAEAVVAELKARGVNARAYQADQASPVDVEQLVSNVARDFGHLDILVNNAGVAVGGGIDDPKTDTAALARHHGERGAARLDQHRHEPKGRRRFRRGPAQPACPAALRTAGGSRSRRRLPRKPRSLVRDRHGAQCRRWLRRLNEIQKQAGRRSRPVPV